MSSSFIAHGFSYHTSCFLLGPFLTAPFQFEVGSSSATVPDLMSEATTFFTRFDQPKINDLDPAVFWGSRPPYVDSMVLEFSRIVLLIWRRSIAVMATLCKDSVLVVLLGSIF